MTLKLHANVFKAKQLTKIPLNHLSYKLNPVPKPVLQKQKPVLEVTERIPSQAE